MLAVEFQANVINGKMEIPQGARERFSGSVNVILFTAGAHHDRSAWPEQNRRRWELIAKKAQGGLTGPETEELTVHCTATACR